MWDAPQPFFDEYWGGRVWSDEVDLDDLYEPELVSTLTEERRILPRADFCPGLNFAQGGISQELSFARNCRELSYLRELRSKSYSSICPKS